MPAFEPAPWGADAELGIVGARVPRMDAPERVTGRARYTARRRPPGDAPRGDPPLDDSARDDPLVRRVARARDARRARRARSGRRACGHAPLRSRDLLRGPAGRRGLRGIHGRRARARRTRSPSSTTLLPFAVTFEDAAAKDAPSVRAKGQRDGERTARDLARRRRRADLKAADVVIRREYRTPVQLHTALETARRRRGMGR